MGNDYWEELAHAYIDCELDPADRAAFEARLAEDENLQRQVAYFEALKTRLKAHAEDIVMPQAVEDRIKGLFERKKQQGNKRHWWTAGLALAATVIIGVLSLQFSKGSYHFTDKVMEGTIVCYGCSVAEHTGLEKGDFCADGHEMSLKADNGKLYRFVRNDAGFKTSGDLSLYNQPVRIEGRVLEQERLILIQSSNQITNRTVELSAHGVRLPVATVSSFQLAY